MTKFEMFTDEELDAMESAFYNEELKYLVEGLEYLAKEARAERRYRGDKKMRNQNDRYRKKKN